MITKTAEVEKSRGYIPGLDGLRAISVFFVICGHAGIPKAPASLGVTIFFFISGFLITGLLLEEAARSDGQISIKNFYARRYFRLMPELTIYVIFVAIGSYLFVAPRPIIELLSALFYFTNYLNIFAPSDPDGPFRLGHLWSLAIEEHFYITWPLLLSACISRKSKVYGIIWVLIVVPLLIRTFALWHGTVPVSYVRFASECRFDSIAFGCLLAALLHYKSPILPHLSRLGHLLGIIGLALIVVFNFGSAINLRGNLHEILVYSGQGIGLLLFFAYLYASDHGEFVLRYLEIKPLRFIGKIS